MKDFFRNSFNRFRQVYGQPSSNIALKIFSVIQFSVNSTPFFLVKSNFSLTTVFMFPFLTILLLTRNVNWAGCFFNLCQTLVIIPVVARSGLNGCDMINIFEWCGLEYKILFFVFESNYCD